jgi:hypothetical protein
MLRDRDAVRTREGAKGAARQAAASLAAALVLSCAALLATPAAAVTLVPVPWVEAGFAETPGTELPTTVSCWEGCAGDAGESFVDLGVLSGPRIEFQTGQVSFEADIVSSIEGNTWTVGIENIAVDLPPLESVSDLWIELFVGVFAAFDVPFDGQSSTTSIALVGPDGLFWVDRSHSALLGLGTGTSSGSVASYVAGDRITFFTDVFFTLSFFDFEDEPRITTRCGRTSELVFEDCTQRLQLFEPVLASSVPEPSAGLLGATILAALAGVGARRRRVR